MNRSEASFVTSSVGMIAFLLWHEVYPDALTLEPNVACVYFSRKVNWGELINSYWMGEKIPVCELSECIVVAQRLLKGGLERCWYRELREAIEEIQEDYVFPVMV